MRLLRASVTPDPPVRPLTHEHSAVLRVSLKVGTRSGFSDYGTIGKTASGFVKGHLSVTLEVTDSE
jgi:hypothetical protein